MYMSEHFHIILHLFVLGPNNGKKFVRLTKPLRKAHQEIALSRGNRNNIEKVRSGHYQYSGIDGRKRGFF